MGRKVPDGRFECNRPGVALESAHRTIIVRMNSMTVSEVARRSGAAPDTIRYYTRIGLLPEPPRSDAGYRLFDVGVLDRLAFIKRAQRLGLRLEEIHELLRVRDEGGCPCGSTQRMLEQRLDELDRQMATLAELRDDVADMLGHMPTPNGDARGCATAAMLYPASHRPEADALPQA